MTRARPNFFVNCSRSPLNGGFLVTEGQGLQAGQGGYSRFTVAGMPGLADTMAKSDTESAARSLLAQLPGEIPPEARQSGLVVHAFLSDDAADQAERAVHRAVGQWVEAQGIPPTEVTIWRRMNLQTPPAHPVLGFHGRVAINMTGVSMGCSPSPGKMGVVHSCALTRSEQRGLEIGAPRTMLLDVATAVQNFVNNQEEFIDVTFLLTSDADSFAVPGGMPMGASLLADFRAMSMQIWGRPAPAICFNLWQ